MHINEQFLRCSISETRMNRIKKSSQMPFLLQIAIKYSYTGIHSLFVILTKHKAEKLNPSHRLNSSLLPTVPKSYRNLSAPRGAAARIETISYCLSDGIPKVIEDILKVQ